MSTSLHPEIHEVCAHPDPRGVLEKWLPFPVLGEVYGVRVEEGSSRGHHLHRSATEWFVGLEGRPLLVTLDPSTGVRQEIPLSKRRVRVPPGLAHAIFAVGEHCVVLAGMDLPHNPLDVVPTQVEAP